MTLALALGAWSSSAHSAARAVQGDCCEEMCHGMPACANMILCQTCAATAAPLHPTDVLTTTYRPMFPTPGQDRVYRGPAWPIWTPPD
jgi:hypothetical protein